MSVAVDRLVERDRSWDPPALDIPPLEATRELVDRRWAETERVRKDLLAEIRRRSEEWTELLAELVRTPSTNPSPEGEVAVADLVASKMRDLGMTVRQLEPVPTRKSNLGVLRGTGSHPTVTRNLLYYGHLDTVPVGLESNWVYPPFSATVADGRLWGRGTKDCKLGVAAALASTQVLQDLGVELAGDLMIVTPGDEETGGHLGIKEIIDAGWLEGVEAAVYGEGMPDRLTIGARGGLQVRIVVKGRSSHTARKQMGRNAILDALRVAEAVDRLTFDDFEPHPLVPGRPSASVNLIRGGFKINVVPDRCELEVDLRFPPNYTDDLALKAITTRLESLRDQPGMGELSYELEPMSVMRPYAVDPDLPLTRMLERCVTETTGSAPQLVGMPASSDARWIFLDGRIPVVNFSHGNESGHQPNEYVDLQAITDNVASYALLTLMLLG